MYDVSFLLETYNWKTVGWFQMQADQNRRQNRFIGINVADVTVIAIKIASHHRLYVAIHDDRHSQWMYACVCALFLL